MYKLLVVDDENIIRNGIIATLRKSVDYFEIFEAGNGKEALQLIEQENIDAMILDIRMPVMNGITVLKNLSESKRDILSVVLTGYDEFDYAKNALEYGAYKYILKPAVPSQLVELAEELKQKLDEQNRLQEEFAALKEDFFKNRQFQKEKLFQNILDGDYSDPWLEEQVRVLDIKLQGPYYQVAVLGIQSYDPSIRMDERYLIDYSIYRFLISYFQDNLSVEFFQVNSDKYGFWFNVSELDNASRVEDLYHLKEEIEQRFHVICAVGLGDVYDKLSYAKFSYVGAENTLKYLSIQQMDYVLEESKLKDDREGRTRLVFDFDEYTIALKSGNISVALDIINDFWKHVSMEADRLQVEEFYLILEQIILSSFQMLYQMSGEESNMDVTAVGAIEQLNQINALEEIRSYLIGLVEKIIHAISETETSGRNNTINKIKDIVEKEYSHPLSMKYIAEKMDLNHIYMGQIFKKETGVSLNDYINKVRVNKAKKLLVESNDMVYEIADKVGYSDPQYFSTVFKRITGVSPKEYRDI